jgi:hypothetical protein
MHSGKRSLMMTSLTHTGTALSSNVAMGSKDAFIRGYSHIPRITPRSTPKILTAISTSHQTGPRALISLIRGNRGNCICPRCLIPKSQLQNLGTKTDASRRVSLARVDDARHRSNIMSARSIIYDKGYAVNSVAVDTLLKEESWAANSVSRMK